VVDFFSNTEASICEMSSFCFSFSVLFFHRNFYSVSKVPCDGVRFSSLFAQWPDQSPFHPWVLPSFQAFSQKDRFFSLTSHIPRLPTTFFHSRDLQPLPCASQLAFEGVPVVFHNWPQPAPAAVPKNAEIVLKSNDSNEKTTLCFCFLSIMPAK